MKTLTPITCYIPDLDDSNYWLAEISNDGDDYSLKSPLKETSVYAFTKEELVDAFKEVYNEGVWREQDGHHVDHIPNKVFAEYIKELLNEK